MATPDLAALIRTIPDFPRPGIRFRDITTLLLDPAGLAEAVRRMVEYALEERGVEWIEVGVAATNARSRAVPERLGFELAGIEAGGLEFPDRTVDRALYVLTL